jgi:chromosomal replication initiator protein
VTEPEPTTDIWNRFQTQLQSAADATTYDVWLSPLSFGGYDGRTLSIAAPAEHHAWITARFMDLLRGAAGSALGDCEVELVQEGSAKPAPASVPAVAAPAAAALNPKLTFDQFVIGEANRFGHAAALAVAEAPGAAYNPLFIYGPPGVGKTHLLHAIGNYTRSFGSGLTVHYATAETFTSDFIGAVKGDGINAFKGRYRANDLLLIDDIQFLQSKARTEDEFFHTFNALQDAGAQIVVTCDRPPDDLGGLKERLRARFGAGLLVDIQSPDPATRRVILRKRLQHDSIEVVDDAVIEFIATRVTVSVRALEGALIRVAAYASLRGQPIDLQLTRDVLDRLYPAAQRRTAPLTIEKIQQVVADSHGLELKDLTSASRAARIVWPRQIAMYLAREHTSETLPAIGRHFGGRDHTTVMHACKRAADRLATDPEQFDNVRVLTERLLSVGADRGN